jgi:hypothetical protein
MNRVLSILDVIGPTGGKVTLETIRQGAGRKAAAASGRRGQGGPPRKRKAAAVKASATKRLRGYHSAANEAARTRKG